MSAQKILAVDDNQDILSLIKRLLEVEGYEIITAQERSEALSIIQETELLCVFLDVALGTDNGIDILQEIKKTHESLPVVMVTGAHEESLALRALNLGAYDYVTKPIDFNYLKNILTCLLAK